MKPHINMTLLAFATTIAFTACEKKADPITEAKKADKKAGIEAPHLQLRSFTCRKRHHRLSNGLCAFVFSSRTTWV